MYKQKRLYLLFALIFLIGVIYMLLSINNLLEEQSDDSIVTRNSTTSIYK